MPNLWEQFVENAQREERELVLPKGQGTVKIVTFDVAHGNCHIIWSPSGKLTVIDLGQSDTCKPIEMLKRHGITTIDLLVITHPHDDHIRSIVHLAGMHVKVLVRPRNIPVDLLSNLDPLLRQHWDHFDTTYSFPIADAVRFYMPDSPAFDGLHLRWFRGSSSSINLNDHSQVTLLDFGGFKMILPGDTEEEALLEICKHPDFIEAAKNTNILVAPHHGRQAGWHAPLFDVIGNPQLVIISDASATETSFASYYSSKANGCTVWSKSANLNQVSKVVSTRNNGHIQVVASRQPRLNATLLTGILETVFSVTVDHF